MYRLFAEDVQVTDSTGHLVASVDELILQPSWTEIFKRKLQFSGLTATGVQVMASQDSTRSWDLIELFRSSSTDSTTPPFEFSIADVEMSDVTLRTRSLASPPDYIENGAVFDYTNSTYAIDDIHVSIDLNESANIVDLYSMTGKVSGTSLTIDDLQGQAVLEQQQISINDIFLQSGEMALEAAGFARGYRYGPNADDREATLAMNVSLVNADNARIRTLLPSWKFESTFDATAEISGPLSSLQVASAKVSTGRSGVQFDGSLTGLPDSVSLTGNISVPLVLADDIDALAPFVQVHEMTRADSVRLESHLELALGHSESRDLLLTLSGMEFQSTAGNISGTASLHAVDGIPQQTWGAVTVSRLNPELISSNPDLAGDVNGHVEFRSSGSSRDDFRLDLIADLASTTVGPISVDSTVINAFIESGILSGDIRARHGSGSIVAGLLYDYSTEIPRYEFEGSATNLNIASMYSPAKDLVDINGRASLYGSGVKLDDIDATLTFSSDESSLVGGDGKIRLFSTSGTTVTLGRDQGSQRLVIDGDLVRGQLHTEQLLSDVRTAGNYWRPVLTKRLRELARSRDGSVSGDDLLAGAPANLSGPKPSKLDVEGDFFIADGSFLSTLLKTPIHARDLAVNLSMSADSSTLGFSSRLTADSLDVYPFQTDSLNVTFDINASLEADSTETVDFATTITGRHGSLLRQKLASPELAIVMSDRVGSFTFKSTNTNNVSPVDISARISNTLEGTTFVFDRLSIESPTYSLALEDEKPIRFFRDAVVVDDLLLARRVTDGAGDEFLSLDGILSTSPGDTLVFESSNLSLTDLSRVFSFRKTIGGRLNSDIRLTMGDDVPLAIGNVHVSNLSVDRRVLGDFAGQSTFDSRDNTVGVSASVKAPAVAPGTDRLVTSNDVELRGTIYPSNEAGHRPLDMDLQVERADLFFFEYIFTSTIDQVSGYAQGGAKITGTLTSPVFDSQMTVRDGDFLVPRFNLHYGIDGAVTVDETGIHIREARIEDGEGGQASITGSVLFNEYSFFSLDLNGVLNQLEIMDVADSDELPFYGHIRASGDATLTGPISGALLQSNNAVTTPESELFIPIVEPIAVSDASFIVFTDSTGAVPDLTRRNQRRNILARRPVGERTFIDGLDMDLNIRGPEGSTVHLVIDPLVGDVINAVGNARVQIQRRGGEFFTYGTFNATGGDYLFTAGEVFVRRFDIDQGGLITWDGDPTNAQLNIPASYRTRASRAGLPSANENTTQSLIPLVVRLNITGRVSAPEVSLSLEIDRSDRNISTSYESIETVLNQPERATEYATSVLLTNSFLLTTQNPNSDAITSSAFNSLSQLVASQLNRYINEALPNIDFSFGIQGENAQELDVTYGIALRLLDERLVIRGQGVYQGARTSAVSDAAQQSLQGEFVVEVRLNPSVSVEVFYRREGDVLTDESFLTNTTGAGLSYQTEFASWRRFFRKILGRDDVVVSSGEVSSGQN